MKSIIVTIICLASIFSYGQRSFEKIDKLTEQRLYKDAIDAYEQVLKKSPESFEAAFKLGKCYYQLNDFENAAQYFEQAKALGCNTVELCYYLGKTKLHQLKYNEAENIFKSASQIVVEDDQQKNLQSRCYSEAQKARSLSLSEKYSSDILVSNITFINSPYSEYGISIKENNLYFSSMRKGDKDATDQRTLQGFSDLYKTSLIREDFAETEIIPLEKSINNKKYNEACIVFKGDDSEAYFTRCLGKPAHCEILKAENRKNGYFNSTNKINLVSKDYSIGHPALSSDGNTMIFVSDMPDGFGKRDLYISTKEDNKWLTPQNLGSTINTEYDEMFPSFFQDDILVFSSSGHNSGGGLDIFISRKEGNTWSVPQKLSSPINTGADDFGMVFNESEEHGYFCSNRPGGAGSDDIYTFDGFPVKVKFSGIVKDKETDELISNALIIIKNEEGFDTLFTNDNGNVSMELPFNSEYEIQIQKDEYLIMESTIKTTEEKSLFPETMNETYLISADTRGTVVEGVVKDNTNQTPVTNQNLMIMGDNGYVDQTITNEEGHYEFTNLNDQTSYTLLLAKKGYWTITKTLEVPELENHKNYSLSTGFDYDFDLVPIPTNEEIVLDNIYYDFNKASLRPESKNELVKLSEMLNQNPNIVVEISSHTDSRGPDDYNMRLSQARAESVVDFLINNGSNLSRLIAKGYGENMPVIANATTEEEHQKNRRTSFKVLEIKDVDVNQIMNQMAPDNPTTPPSAAGTSQEVIYKVQVCASKSPVESESYFDKITEAFPEIVVVEEKYPDGFYRYIAGTFISYSDAQLLRDKIVDLGYSDCFIGVFKNNKRIK
jgi:outer membrane protein OmpA-like peptidoglycan-associated protein/tetratricopeptide (TPR) repeat protein